MSSNHSPKDKLICVVGPTASGKTALALDVACKVFGEIVNGDSRQIYRELHIGTAKPDEHELKQAVHHLIDVASIQDSWSAAKFSHHAHETISKIHSENKTPIVVGGTGLYVKSLLFGLDEIPAIDPELRASLRQRFETEGIESLYDELKVCDSDSASELKSGDTQRILRALEVFHQTGKSIRSFWKENENKPALYDHFKVAIDWPREVLYKRIDDRVLEMMERGLKAEAQELFAKYPENLVLKKTIGYAEWDQYGFSNDQKVIEEIQKNSRRFAKRQITWFKGENDVIWVTPDQLEVTVEKISSFLKE